MDPIAIDRSLEGLSQVKDRWATLPIREKIRYLEQVRDLLVDNADAWVAAGVQLKGLDPKAPIVGGEEWLGGPYPTAAWLTDMIGTLTRLNTGADRWRVCASGPARTVRWSPGCSPPTPTTGCCSTAMSWTCGCSPG